MREGFDSVIVTKHSVVSHRALLDHWSHLRSQKISVRVTELVWIWNGLIGKRGNNTENYKDIKCVYSNYSSMDG